LFGVRLFSDTHHPVYGKIKILPLRPVIVDGDAQALLPHHRRARKNGCSAFLEARHQLCIDVSKRGFIAAMPIGKIASEAIYWGQTSKPAPHGACD
jgi:hypothetical protein